MFPSGVRGPRLETDSGTLKIFSIAIPSVFTLIVVCLLYCLLSLLLRSSCRQSVRNEFPHIRAIVAVFHSGCCYSEGVKRKCKTFHWWNISAAAHCKFLIFPFAPSDGWQIGAHKTACRCQPTPFNVPHVLAPWTYCIGCHESKSEITIFSAKLLAFVGRCWPDRSATIIIFFPFFSPVRRNETIRPPNGSGLATYIVVGEMYGFIAYWNAVHVHVQNKFGIVFAFASGANANLQKSHAVFMHRFQCVIRSFFSMWN